MASRKIVGVALAALVLGGLGGFVLVAISPGAPALTCGSGGPGCQVTEQLLFITGYNDTAGGFVFVVANTGDNPAVLTDLFVDGNRTGFAISPTVAGSYCDGATDMIDVGSRCLESATYPRPLTGEQVVKFVADDGSMFTGFLWPGPQQPESGAPADQAGR